SGAPRPARSASGEFPGGITGHHRGERYRLQDARACAAILARGEQPAFLAGMADRAQWESGRSPSGQRRVPGIHRAGRRVGRARPLLADDLLRRVGHFADHDCGIDRVFLAMAIRPAAITNAIGMSNRPSPGPKNGSPRLKLAHSEASEPGGWREKTIASSCVIRLTDV